MNDVELVAQQVARLTKQNEEQAREIGDAKNRHDALREEFDLFRETMLEQLGIRSLKVLGRRRVRV